MFLITIIRVKHLKLGVKYTLTYYMVFLVLVCMTIVSAFFERVKICAHAFPKGNVRDFVHWNFPREEEKNKDLKEYV